MLLLAGELLYQILKYYFIKVFKISYLKSYVDRVAMVKCYFIIIFGKISLRLALRYGFRHCTKK